MTLPRGPRWATHGADKPGERGWKQEEEGTWAGAGMCQFSRRVDLSESAKPFLRLSQYRLKPKLLLTSSKLI